MCGACRGLKRELLRASANPCHQSFTLKRIYVKLTHYSIISHKSSKLWHFTTNQAEIAAQNRLAIKVIHLAGDVRVSDRIAATTMQIAQCSAQPVPNVALNAKFHFGQMAPNRFSVTTASSVMKRHDLIRAIRARSTNKINSLVPRNSQNQISTKLNFR